MRPEDGSVFASLSVATDNTIYWSGGGYAHANTKNGSAKVGRKGDPLLVSMVVASRSRRGPGREEWCDLS